LRLTPLRLALENNLQDYAARAFTNLASFTVRDRNYRLAKCQGTFGLTYLTANGALANMKLDSRHFLIQQNQVNAARKGYCGLSNP